MGLSIIIINWNTKALLKGCLNSVYTNAPTKPFEIIVVDNASNDGSQQMVANDFPTVKLIENTENLGFAKANNIGIEACTGDKILLLNSDTLIHGDVLDRSIDYLTLNSQVGAVGCRVLNADNSLQHSTSQFPSFLNLFLQTTALDRIRALPALQRYRMQYWKRNEAKAVNTVSGCFIMTPKTALEKVGLLDDAFFFFGEETDWCKRLRDNGLEVHFAPVGKITHFGGGSSGNLNHKRDLMLTQATVRLHLKHHGLVSALAVFLLLLMFNTSRAVFWTFKAIFCSNRSTQIRKRHFLGVCGAFLKAWPGKIGAIT